MENKEFIGAGINTEVETTVDNSPPASQISQVSQSNSTSTTLSPSVGSKRRLTRSKSSFSVAFDRHIDRKGDIKATIKTSKQLLKHAFTAKLTLTERLKIIRNLIRKFTTLNLNTKNNKFKIVLPLDIVDYFKSFTDLIK